jgi:Trypsin-like peptidase domain
MDKLSVTSLNLKMLHNEAAIGTATGFVVAKNSHYYLVTNRHVVLGCALDTSPSNLGGWICANKLSILHNRQGHLGEWAWVTEELFDEHDKKRWFEHPTLAGRADLVALPLAHIENVQLYPLDIALRNTDIELTPGDTVSIVGFPFGQAQGAGLAIWKTGTVASDLDVNFSSRPMFLVDTTSRPGMSGSPVYAVRSGAYRSSDANLKMAINGTATRFLGVYSEQNLQAELGVVWKAEAVQALYDSLP